MADPGRASTDRTLLQGPEQAAFLNSILESSTGYSIVAKDLDGTIVAWNEGARRTYGYDPEDVVGKARAFILHDPEDVRSGRARAILDEARASGKWEGELTRVRKDGGRFTAHVTVTLRRDSVRTPLGFTMISRDLTESQHIEHELRKSEVAATGAEALAASRRTVFDAITLDLALPDMGGAQVLRAIRNDGLNVATPVIIVTVSAERGIGAGFQVQDILVKPVEAEDLLSTLQRANVTPREGHPILVIDDDAAALKLAAATLGQLGFDAVCRPDVESGLQAAGHGRPAAVILDLLLPGQDGFDFLRRYRASPGGRDVPVIVWTVKDVTGAERSRLLSHAQAVVSKHLGTGALVDEVRACVPLPSAGQPEAMTS